MIYFNLVYRGSQVRLGTNEDYLDDLKFEIPTYQYYKVSTFIIYIL